MKRTLFAAIVAATLSSACSAQLQVTLDNWPLQFPNAQPQMVSGRVMVPMRRIFEALKATVSWDDETQTVTAIGGQRKLVLQIGANQATVNGASVPLDVPASVINNSTLVPLRLIGEALGCDVDWVETTQTVAIRHRFEPTAPAAPVVPTYREVNVGLTSSRSGLIGIDRPVRFTLTGPRGGSAEMQIPGVTGEVAMTETSPGTYTLNVEAPTGIAVTSTTAVGRLRYQGRDYVAQLVAPISFDTVPPEIRPAYPPATGQIYSSRPEISARLDDGPGPGIDPASVTIRLDGADITNRAKIAPWRAELNPDFDLASGPHQVDIALRDRAGNRANAHWSFVIAPERVPDFRVNWSTPPVLTPGSLIVFSVNALPGSDVFCDLGPRVGLVHMREASRGRFTGQYVSKRGDDFEDEPVVIRVHAPGGRMMVFQADHHLHAHSGELMQPVITGPHRNDRISTPFSIVGKAAPGAAVHIRITYSAKLFGVIKASGGVSDQTVVAGYDGGFHSHPIGLRLHDPQAVYTATVETRWPNGRTSPSSSVQFSIR